ncbi:MAG TPA: hypothetical protein VIE67_14700 [Rudaea sp.]|jgi:hypothetical protein
MKPEFKLVPGDDTSFQSLSPCDRRPLFCKNRYRVRRALKLERADWNNVMPLMK